MNVNEQTPLNRRRFIHASCATLAGVTISNSTMATPLWAGEATADGLIDAHSHIWTRDVAKFPLADGQTVDDLDPPSFTAEELVRTAKSVGVNRVVLIQHHIYYGWDNSYLIDAAGRYPNRFRIVAMVDDTTPHPDLAMKQLLAKNVTGFRITPRVRGKEKWLTGPGIAAMWRMAAETRQAMCCLIDPDDLPAVGAMCRKYPDTPVVIDHLARIGAEGVIRDTDVQRLCDLAKHKKTFLKVSAFYALGKKQPPYLDLAPMIRRVYDAFGPRRLMWASDSPYQIVAPHTYAGSIGLVRDRLDFLPDTDKEWLLRKTAEHVFFSGS